MTAHSDSQAISTHAIIDGWWQKAFKLPSPNFNARPVEADVSLLVIHNISLPPGDFGGGYIESFFLNELDAAAHPYFKTIADMQVSAHCLIDRRGRVTQFVSFEDRAWHAGRSSFKGRKECNDFGIGVELEGTDHLAYTKEQYASLLELSEALFKTYPKLSLERVVGHSDIAPERKTDPGEAFDWSAYQKALLQRLEQRD